MHLGTTNLEASSGPYASLADTQLRTGKRYCKSECTRDDQEAGRDYREKSVWICNWLGLRVLVTSVDGTRSEKRLTRGL